MKTIEFITVMLLFCPIVRIQAQSVDYVTLEKRFVKRDLSAKDTLAFRELGEQKVRQLFDKSQFHAQNYSNASNQAYVKRQIPDLFYIPPGDTLDVQEIIQSIESSKLTKGQVVELRTQPESGYLGKTETLNSDPKFTFELILLQVPKSFGKEIEMVWQVFLHRPQQWPGNAAKSGKLKKAGQ